MSSKFSDGRNTSRRSACDRCREHKLRCLRDNANQEPCRRCSRAGANCITGQALPPGRPIHGARLERRGNNATSSRRIQVAAPSDDGFSPALGSLPLEIDSNQPNGNDALPQSTQQDASLITLNIPGDAGDMNYVPSWLRTSSDHTHQSHNSGSMTANQDERDIPGSAMPMVGVVNSPGGHGDALHWMEPDSLDHFGLMFPGNNELYTPQQDAPDIPAMPTFEEIGLQPGELPTGFHDTQRFTRASTPAVTETLGTPPTTDTCEIARLPDQRIASDYMQQLSYVNLNLDKLLRRIDTASPPATLNNLVFPHPDDYPKKTITIGDTLLLSTKFLDILNFLQPPRPLASFTPGESFTPTDSESHSQSTPGQTGTSTGSASNVSSNSSASCDKSAAPRSPNPSHSATLSRQTDPPVTSVYLGTPGILLILSCYQQFIRMYSIIFSIAYDAFAEHTLPGFPPSLSGLPGIRYSEFPVDSGNLQTMLLIQITLHLVGHMEKVLGLPREFRVQEVGGEYNGILSSEAGLRLLRMVVGDVSVGEETGDAGGGYSGRGDWKELNLLRSSIQRITHTVQNSMAW
ncbi:hypothetical protein V502_08872 [Pseudogymnoascus sp. VKM F-4520 (FW-2644)]|nr:hypothetical protein V502_08872 [Pseudogymnoascus sp. VKM F-4520 (FW-2644)]